ncbi:leucine-rich repeat domain-containing protein [Mediterranea massiliensis]|uniref:leucine-rich repeat domain-containing protein n=1 Tax=Mediterranea massiliensis TaxID=1841865 RepID=UPI0025A46D5F|nr:leucine-rich repeat domain-containing protein [Mediterranea massiliensis]MDM8339155.1 leucine-rich repeat domain-containing protein [Mediterranea massiliensis]
MKTTRILSLAAAVLTLAACGNEEFIENNPGNEAAKPVPMTFTAGMPQTRTQLAAGNEVHWTEGDKIALWDGVAVQEFTATTISGSNATFEGYANVNENYTAFYPYSENLFLMDGTSATFNLPAEQTAVASTFANQLAPSLAKATGGSTNLEFNNLCALVKFTAAEGMTGTLSFVGGNGNEMLAGRVECTFATGNLSFPDTNEAATRVSLKGTFEAGKTYYFVVTPAQLYNGFSLLFEDGEGKLYRKATNRNTQLQAGHILNLGELALTSFEKAVIKEIYPAGTPNADGTVTITDLSELETLTEVNVSDKGLYSLGGIGYCTGLTKLVCSRNKLTELNISGLTKLTYLDCWNNQLTELDLSGLAELTYLDFSVNELSLLNLSGLTKLTYLDCSMNELSALDLTEQTELTKLVCVNTKVSELNVNHLTKLEVFECYYNKLTKLDVSKLTGLKDLRCHYNQLTELNLSGLTQLTTLWCFSNNLTALDITQLSGLNRIYCGNQNDERELTLTLKAAQEGVWNRWSSDKDNVRVKLNVVP